MSKVSSAGLILFIRKLTRHLILFAVFIVAAGPFSMIYAQKLPKIKAPTPKYSYSAMEIQSETFQSTLTVRVNLPLSELERRLNEELTGLIYEDNSYSDNNQDNLKAKVWKLSDIKIEAKGNQFVFDVPLNVWASAGYKISPFGYNLEGYRDTEFQLRVRLISFIEFSKDWRLITNTRVESYDWITEPAISVAGFYIPVKGMISKMLNKNADKITAAIDNQVKENFQVKDRIEQAWVLAQEPQKLSEEYRTWLINTPETVEAILPDARNGVLMIHLGIKGYTQTIVSETPPVRTKIMKLPPLRIVGSLPETFSVGLISSISYEEASKMAEAYFRGKIYYFSGNRYSVQINNIELFGQDDRLVIKAGISGSINGDVYLKGVPKLHPSTHTLYLDALEYDLNTRNVLVKAASWLLHGRFLRMMKDALVFPIADELNQLTKTLRDSLEKNQVAEGILLNGQLDDIKPEKINLTPEHIFTVIHATGTLGLEIEKLNY